MSILIFRGVERLLIILFAGLCIYLGYRLFDKAMPSESELRGEFGKSSLTLRRVAPGVLFAVFGIAVLTVALIQAVRMDTRVSAAESHGPEVPSPRNTAATTFSSSTTWQNPNGAIDPNSEDVKDLVAIKTILYYGNLNPPDPATDRDAFNGALNRVRLLRLKIVDAIEGAGAAAQFASLQAKVSTAPDLPKTWPDADRLRYERIQGYLQEGKP